MARAMQYGVWSEQELDRGDEADSCIWSLSPLAGGRNGSASATHTASPSTGASRLSMRAMATGCVAGGGVSCLQDVFFRRASPKMASDAGDAEVLPQPGFWIHALTFK